MPQIFGKTHSQKKPLPMVSKAMEERKGSMKVDSGAADCDDEGENARNSSSSSGNFEPSSGENESSERNANKHSLLQMGSKRTIQVIDE